VGRRTYISQDAITKFIEANTRSGYQGDSTLIPLESGGQARIASPAHAGEVELVVAARQPRAFSRF
jgi:hypothetical protein